MSGPQHDTGIFFMKKLEALYVAEVEQLQKAKIMFRLFTLFWEELTDNENVQFTSLFARLAYSASNFKISGKTLFLAHRFRRLIESKQLSEENAKQIFELGAVALKEVILELFSIVSHNQKLSRLLPPKNLIEKKYKVEKFYPIIRVAIMKVDVDNLSIDFVSDDEAHVLKTAHFDIEDKNTLFNSTIQRIPRFFDLPLTANLVDVELDDEGRYIPGAIVLKPDFLIDATAVAKMWQKHGPLPIGYLISKFIPINTNPAILMGNIANGFLDTLVYQPDISWSDIRRRIFAINPLQIAQYNDGEVKDMLKDAHLHYKNIREVIKREMVDHNIEKDFAYVEPSFLSSQYGFQGRLDLLHLPDSGDAVDIIELKSGKPYMANSNGISEAHYRQLMIYDMMIKGTLDKKIQPKNFILYSKLKEQRLRYAGYSRSHQYEIIHIRNGCMISEQLMLNAAEEGKDLFEKFNPVNIGDQFRFERRDAEKLFIAYKKLDALEKKYIKHFTAFITREYHLTKTGEHGIDRSNGMAGLWLDPEEEKIEQFRMLSKLRIGENRSAEKDPFVKLLFTERSNRLSRFRVGDIVIIYPNEENHKTANHYQLFKGSIIEIEEEYVLVRLRAQQMNDSIFDKYELWNIEPDFLDGGNRRMFESLYRFMHVEKEKRELWLSRRPPERIEQSATLDFEGTTAEQSKILNEIIQAKDYYLLWGPPGTGKTSVMLRHLVDYHHSHTKQNILLLAYTNRAVDEICTAIESIDPLMKEKYLRIGSRYSTKEKFLPRMLSSKLEEIESRKQLLELLQNTRIFTSTVSSMLGKFDLLSLKKFDLVVIDEASQLLEPMLLGLVSQFTKVVLIGDHKQLPAVVTQSSTYSVVKEKELLDIGLTDLSESLFQRMYIQATENNWNWSLGILTQQGRMHQNIMKFAANNFYNGQLQILEKLDRLSADLNLSGASDSFSWLQKERMIFIDTPIDDVLTQKINLHESKYVVDIIKQLIAIYESENKEITADSIGVITPFRAQIAKIAEDFQREKIDNKLITIDTVERYQGGARDHIIISLVTNDRNVLNMISNKSMEGIDRKLNVAITRAREQLILLGNRAILEKDPSYKELISHCFVVEKS